MTAQRKNSDRIALDYVRLQARVEQLEHENAKLQRAVASLKEQLGPQEAPTMPDIPINEQSGTWTR